jgi:uncharacterized protein YlzI (FlbEa/FlbD family)
MKNFIELTQPNGEKFLAGLLQIQRIIDSKGVMPNETTYIGGLTNNGGIYVRETYEEVLKKIRLHDEKHK